MCPVSSWKCRTPAEEEAGGLSLCSPLRRLELLGKKEHSRKGCGGEGGGSETCYCVTVQRMGLGSRAEMSKYGQGNKEKGARRWEGQAWVIAGQDQTCVAECLSVAFSYLSALFFCFSKLRPWFPPPLSNPFTRKCLRLKLHQTSQIPSGPHCALPSPSLQPPRSFCLAFLCPPLPPDFWAMSGGSLALFLSAHSSSPAPLSLRVEAEAWQPMRKANV